MTREWDTTVAMRDYFDTHASCWDEHSRADPDKIRTILRRAGLAPGMRLLDVACGTGILFPHLLEYAPQLLRAIDLSPEMVRLASQKHCHPRLSVSEADFYLFDEAGFDALIVYNAYPHFLDKRRFGEAASRCLKPGGRLVIAHGCKRERINRRHTGHAVRPIFTSLQACQDEAQLLEEWFVFDVMVDTDELYLLSGAHEPRYC